MKATVGTELRAAKFQPHARVEIHPICPLQTRTLWVIHNARPASINTMIYIDNNTVRTAKSADYLGNAGCSATLITSNLPFDEWTETFGTERLTGALLDRLTHHVNILEMNGESYRLAQSRTRKSTETA